jgi:hypothetical protein
MSCGSFAPALGHPARVSGRAEVQFAAWFVGAVENFRFFDVRVQACADPEPELRLLHQWLDSLTGIGLIAAEQLSDQST